MSVKHVFPDVIMTDVCHMYRWPDPIFRARPGAYFVIATSAVLELLGMADPHRLLLGFMHPTAVVDDFGDLVGVPA